ncbi:MAG: coproporphyrinogen dehydrogenase HemZ [Clostridiales bacterium]|nr:coproporphyrinogen dehydrogenase HemZ [Clostridiales bacterium]
MAALKHLRFASNHAGDLTIYADYMRTYGYLLADAAGETRSVGIDSASPALRLTWAAGVAGVTIEWAEGGASFSHYEEIKPAVFQETEENRRRRVMRLAFHHLLEKEPGLREQERLAPSPWGILTGVRPTKMLHRFLDQGLSDAEITLILRESFGMDAGRISLLLDVCLLQRPRLPLLQQGRKKISLYLSYPFCPSRCEYCSFPGYDLKRWRKWQEPCLRAMELEISSIGRAAADMGFQVETFYFGGGTPTCMPPEEMDRILGAVEGSFAFLPGYECTVESGRPETLTREMVGILAAHPVNRICVNPQSMVQATLDRIGRRHGTAAVAEGISAARAGFPADRGLRVNCDFILGLPGEKPEDVAYSINEILGLKPDNITLHGLAIKRGSVYKESGESMPGSADGREMIRQSREMMDEAGYKPYYLYRQKDSLAGGENVGYCLPGRECLYNILMIEERQTILGLGAGAGSKFLEKGGWALENIYNPKDMIQYIEGVEGQIRRKVDKLAILA